MMKVTIYKINGVEYTWQDVIREARKRGYEDEGSYTVSRAIAFLRSEGYNITTEEFENR